MTQKDNAVSSAARMLLFGCGAMLAFGWWELFHNLGQSWILTALDAGTTSTVQNIFLTLHCPARYIGILAGAGAYLWLSRLGRQAFVLRVNPAWWVVLFAVIDLLHYSTLTAWGAYGLGSLLYMLVSAAITYAFIGVSQALFSQPLRTVFVFVIVCGPGCAVVNAILAPTTHNASVVFGEAARLVFLLGAATCLVAAHRLSQRTTKDPKSGPFTRAQTIKVSRGLVMHLVIYGLVLAFLHTIGRRIAYSSQLQTDSLTDIIYVGDTSLAIGALLACLIVAGMYFRKDHSFSSVWSVVRKAVFTLTVLEFILLPAINTTLPAVIAGDSASMLYQMLFILGCCAIFRESDHTASSLTAWGLVLLSAGQVASGLFCEFAFIDPIAVDSTLFAVLRVVAFLLCMVATFWVGSDADIKKLWGLRHNFTPKQYNDVMLQRKCDKLAGDFNLTQREANVITLLAQGVRQKQISRTLYVSPNTVRTHIRNAYAKLDIHSVDELNDLLADTHIDT